jgi:hypothetical protein
MPTIRPIFNDFSAGELSPRLAGRVDLPVYYRGAQELTNFQTRVLGGAGKRPGTKYVQSTDGSKKARLIPFVIDANTVFLIELTGATVSPAAPGKIRLLDAASGLWVSNGGNPASIPTSYTDGDLFQIRYAQTHREVMLVHPDYPPLWFRYVSGTPTTAVLDYTTSDQSFAGNLIEWTAPTETPYDTYELWEQVAQWLSSRKDYPASGTFNSKTVTGIRRNDLALTVTFSDETNVVITRGSTYSYQGTISMDMRPFIGAGNYPGAVCYFGGRLWMGGSRKDPAVLWGSKPWDYKNFVLFEEIVYKTKEEKPSGEVGNGFTCTASATTDSVTLKSVTPVLTIDELKDKYASGVNVAYGTKVVSNTADTITLDRGAIGSGSFAVRFTDWKDAMVPEFDDSEDTTQQVGAGSAVRLGLATEEDERIVWISAAQDLYVGTTSSEWVIPGTSNAVQARAIIASRYGSADIQSRYVGDGLMYVAPASRHIRQLSTGGGAPLTLQAEHMVKVGITQLDFAQVPDMCLYAVLANGELARCLMEPSTGVIAWDRIKVRDGDSIESVAVVPGADRDYVYMVVKRTINGSAVRFIEVLQENEDDSPASQWYLDAAVSKSGAAFTTVTGLAHFNGQEVKVRYVPAAGGIAVATVTVSGGSVTIPSATYALVGLPYSAVLRTHLVNSADSEGLHKGIGRVFFRLYKSNGFMLRYDETSDPIPVDLPSGYTGAHYVTTDIPTMMDVGLRVESDDPVPVNIQSIVPEAEIGG